MIRNIPCIPVVPVMMASILTITGCSVFISTPRVARIHVQRLDNKLVEYVVNLENPAQSNVGIRLNNDYSLKLDFQWLWHMDERSDIYSDVYLETDLDSEDPRLTPWMLCKYRF
jgi:hypothetical protein